MKAPLCTVEEIPDEGAKVVDFFGREALVYKVDGAPRATMNACVHLGGPLERRGCEFVCAWHGAAYADADGRRTRGPGRADARLMTLPTRVEAGVLMYVYGE
jgi:nitrite reductase/ring-hydroxylating ferredoxin subunit